MPAVPNTILTTLLGGFASHIGDQLRERHTSLGRQTPLHPGDHYGRVLAWAWETERPLAMLLLLDVLVALRTTPPDRPAGSAAKTPRPPRSKRSPRRSSRTTTRTTTAAAGAPRTTRTAQPPARPVSTRCTPAKPGTGASSTATRTGSPASRSEHAFAACLRRSCS